MLIVVLLWSCVELWVVDNVRTHVHTALLPFLIPYLLLSSLLKFLEKARTMWEEWIPFWESESLVYTIINVHVYTYVECGEMGEYKELSLELWGNWRDPTPWDIYQKTHEYKYMSNCCENSKHSLYSLSCALLSRRVQREKLRRHEERTFSYFSFSLFFLSPHEIYITDGQFWTHCKLSVSSHIHPLIPFTHNPGHMVLYF